MQSPFERKLIMILFSVSLFQIIMMISQQRKSLKNTSNVTSLKSNQQNITPPRRINSKSPINSNKCNHQSNQQQSVSYGQLQIVLENLQAIKQKASQQVKLLNQENLALKDQINELRAEFESFEDKLKGKDGQIKKVQELMMGKVWEKEKEIRQLQQKMEEKEKLVKLFEQKQKGFDRILEENNHLKQRWVWAFDILAGKEERAEQLVWKIKSQNCSIWQMFDKQIALIKSEDLSKQKMETVSEQLLICREQYKHTSQMLDKALNELNTANVKILSLQDKLQEHSELISVHKQKNSQFQQQITEEKLKNHELSDKIQGLTSQIEQLSKQLEHKQIINKDKEKEDRYNNMINSVCDERQDYEQVVQNMQQLQKFKQEHYRNIAKIQHLCQLIDSS